MSLLTQTGLEAIWAAKTLRVLVPSASSLLASPDSRAANALLFKALSCGSQLSQTLGQQQLAAKWTQLSQKVKRP